MAPALPCIGFFPALPLAKNVELGDWVVGNPAADVPWRSPQFRAHVDKLLGSIDDEFRGGAMVWHHEHGFDGMPPSDREREAIRAAIAFAALDLNDHVDHKDPNGGRHLVTTENTILYVQPIDEDRGWITHVREGALKSTLTGGWKIGEKAISLPDAVFPTDRSLPISSKLAGAIFSAHLGAATDVEMRRVTIALEWHRVALSNPVAVTHQQRLVALKTAFESLFGTSNSWSCAHKLRTLFEEVTAPHRTLLPWSGVLWSPRERTDLRREVTQNGKVRQVIRSEVEDWFMTLADVRNSIIHDGVLSATAYEAPPERPLSRYKGWLFWTGERLLREAVKAKLGADVLLCALLKERALWEALYDQLQLQRSRLQPAPLLAHEEPEDNSGQQPRTVPELLKTLGCSSASEVEISPATPGASASPDVAAEMAAAARQFWVAEAGAASVLVTARERELLESAGAEWKLSRHFGLCD